MTTIKLKNGSGAPTAGDLVQGEPALDLTNKRLYTEDSGGTVIEVGTNPGVDVTFADDRKAIFGAGSDLQIYHDGTHSRIDDAGTGALILRADYGLFVQKYSDNTAMFNARTDGAIELFHNGSEKLATTSTGIDVTGTVSADSYDIGSLGTLGSVATDRLFIATADGLGLQFDFDNSRIVPVGADGSTYNNNVSLGSSGLEFKNLLLSGNATVGGTVTANGLTVDGSATIQATSSPAISVIDTTNNAEARLQAFNSTATVGTQSNHSFGIETNDTNRALFSASGDISFYEDTGTTAKFFWDASEESLGIGTDSPNDKVDISGSTGDGYRLTDGTHTGVYRSISGGTILKTTSNHALLFGTNDTEAMRIDSSGNLLVGTTDAAPWDNTGSASGAALRADGRFSGAVVGGEVILLNRLSTDGVIADFRKDGTTVGSIATNSSRFELDGSGNPVRMKAGTSNIQVNNNTHISFDTAGGEAARFDSSGNLLVGTTDSSLYNNSTGTGVVLGLDDSIQSARLNDAPLLLNRQGTDGSIAVFYKDGSTVGSIGVALSDNIYLAGNSSHVGIGFGSTSVYGATSGGAIDDDAVDLGASNARFKDIYATNGTIQTSDRNEKQDIEALSDAEQRVAVAAKGLLRKFRWIDSVEKKGDEARIHFGIIAQDLQDAFTAEGLDAGRYAMFINSTWTDEETGEERSRMGVRYSELLAFIIAAI